MPKKSEDIKVRVDPLTKVALREIAERETLELSDVVRHALRDFVRQKSQQQSQPLRHAA